MKKIVLFLCTLALLVTSCFSLLACDNKAPQKKYDKASLEINLNVGDELNIDAKASVSYCKTKDGIDFVLDANVLNSTFKVKVYYVGGDIVIGSSSGEDEMKYMPKIEIGTINDLIDSFFEIPQVKTIYDFVGEVIDRNEIEADISLDKIKSLISLPEFEDGKSFNLKDGLEGIIDFIVDNQDTLIYDYVLGLIVDSKIASGEVAPQNREGTIAQLKSNVSTYLSELLDDDITIEGFLNKILGLISEGLTIKDVMGFIDMILSGLQIETQELVDLVNTVFGFEMPDAPDGVSFSEHALTQLNGYASMFGEYTEILDVKVCELIGALMQNTEFSLETDVLPMINGMLGSMTFKGAIQSVLSSIGLDLGVDTVLGILSSISVEKFELTLNHCTDGVKVFALPKIDK